MYHNQGIHEYKVVGTLLFDQMILSKFKKFRNNFLWFLKKLVHTFHTENKQKLVDFQFIIVQSMANAFIENK